MDIKGYKVISTTFMMGIVKKEGTIVDFEGENIVVEYSDKQATYTIDSFLSSVDKKILSVNSYVYDFLKKEKEKKKSYTEKNEKGKDKIKATYGSKYYFVFQGIEFEREITGGYLFALDNESIHHWKRIKNLRVGDVILHGTFQGVIAISVVTRENYQGTRDGESKIGIRADCKCFLLKNPLDLSSKREKLQALSKGEYQPFDKNGKGNQGYLFDMNPNLAKGLIEMISENNQATIKDAFKFKESILLNQLSEIRNGLSYKNTFIFKYETVEYHSKKGYAVYNICNEKVGLFWKYHQANEDVAEGQAEILFFDQYYSEFNKWRRIFKSGQRVMYDNLLNNLRLQSVILMTIDPQNK